MTHTRLDGERVKNLLAEKTKAHLRTDKIKELGEEYHYLLQDFMSVSDKVFGTFTQYADGFFAELYFTWTVEKSTYNVPLELRLVGNADKEEEFSVPDGDWRYRIVLQALQEWIGSEWFGGKGKLVNRVYYEDEGHKKSIYPSLVVEETDVGQVVIGYKLSDDEDC